MNTTQSIEHYISDLSPLRKERVMTIVDYIQTNYPSTQAIIQYNIPMYTFNNGYIGFASQKTYLSFYCDERRIIKYVREQSPKTNTGKGCIRFKDSEHFDPELMKQVIDKLFTERNICFSCTKKPCDNCQL